MQIEIIRYSYGVHIAYRGTNTVVNLLDNRHVRYVLTAICRRRSIWEKLNKPYENNNSTDTYIKNSII